MKQLTSLFKNMVLIKLLYIHIFFIVIYLNIELNPSIKNKLVELLNDQIK